MDQIQVLVDRDAASWYYNGYFASFTPEEVASAEPVYRIYFRNNFFTDTPAQATLPTNATPALNHVPGASGKPGMSNATILQNYPFGFVNKMLFSLAGVSWSSRFGGSAVLEFRQAAFAGPNEPRVTKDDFEYELYRVVGGDEYLFDLNDVVMRVFVNPLATDFNPKQTTYFRMPTFVEFSAGSAVTYKNGVVVPTDLVEDVLRETLDSAARRVAGQIGGTTGYRPPANQFVLAFIHNQFQNLIGVNDKVTRLYLADNWLDVVTQEYEPYVFVSFSIDEVFMETSMWEGEPELKVNIKSFETPQGAGEHRLTSNTDEIGRNESTGWSTVAAFSVPECALIDHLRVRVEITEVDPWSPDDDVGTKSLEFLVNCDAINAQAAQQSYTGYVNNGLFPMANGTVLNCGDSFTDPAQQIDPDLGCRRGTELHGRIVFPRSLEPSDCHTVQRPSGEETLCQFPLDVVVPWRAQVGIGAR